METRQSTRNFGKKINMEAFIERYITGFYKSKVAQESKWPAAIKEQIVQTTGLYYKYIIRDGSVPDDGIPCTFIVSWCSVPLDLVVKLGWVGFMRSSSSGGGARVRTTPRKLLTTTKPKAKPQIKSGGHRWERLLKVFLRRSTTSVTVS